MSNSKAQNGDENPTAWAQNLPGESPDAATLRAKGTISKAAAKGNKTAAKMDKANKKEDNKR